MMRLLHPGRAPRELSRCSGAVHGQPSTLQPVCVCVCVHYTLHFTLHTAHYTLHTTHHTLHPTPYTPRARPARAQPLLGLSARSTFNPTPWRAWYFIAEQPAPAHPRGCAALRVVLLSVPCVSRSCEHLPDGFDLHPGRASSELSRCSGSLGAWSILNLQPYTLHPTPYTPIPEPQTLNPKS
jgi:hypothetical protein